MISSCVGDKSEKIHQVYRIKISEVDMVIEFVSVLCTNNDGAIPHGRIY